MGLVQKFNDLGTVFIFDDRILTSSPRANIYYDMISSDCEEFSDTSMLMMFPLIGEPARTNFIQNTFIFSLTWLF